jgi:hypothetical protein
MEGELAGRRREVVDKVVVCQDTPPQMCRETQY